VPTEEEGKGESGDMKVWNLCRATVQGSTARENGIWGKGQWRDYERKKVRKVQKEENCQPHQEIEEDPEEKVVDRNGPTRKSRKLWQE